MLGFPPMICQVKPSPVGVCAWQHVLPEAQVEVVEDVSLGLRAR